jgi:pimeloyl-ACP methyl ester carboxylesterase
MTLPPATQDADTGHPPAPTLGVRDERRLAETSPGVADGHRRRMESFGDTLPVLANAAGIERSVNGPQSAAAMLRVVEAGGAEDRRMVLGDGRTLGWAEYGDARGRPVVAVHGSPDSRRIWALLDAGARAHGLRLVCPDRPGFGLSDAHPTHSVLGWVDDLSQLVEQLKMDQFPVVAISGGGEYACAAAWRMHDQVSGLGLFSVTGPLNHKGAMAGMNWKVKSVYGMARFAPFLLRPLARAMVRTAQRDPAKAYARLAASRPPEDRAVFERPAVRDVLLANLPEQFRDAESMVREFRIAVQPWPVPLAEIGVPTHIW